MKQGWSYAILALNLLFSQYSQLLKDPLVFYSAASSLQRSRTVLFLPIANTKQLEQTYKQTTLTKNNTPIGKRLENSVLKETARCYGYENARDTKKRATVKRKPLSKYLYYIIKETTSLFYVS